jgi:pyridoxal phosphate enzyme (YggS family)
MPINLNNYNTISASLKAKNVELVAVSKTKPISDILELYNLGQRSFGENYVQELTEKQGQLPSDIHWHFIGHLQRNKVKYIAPFVHLIHGVDSYSLLEEINKQASKNNRVIDCLLQVYIAKEETKFGMDEVELAEAVSKLDQLKSVRVVGLMGMASFSENKDLIRAEFAYLKRLQQKLSEIQFTILSMGMSSDYEIAIEEGSNLVRIGSLLFGAREYKTNQS